MIDREWWSGANATPDRTGRSTTGVDWGVWKNLDGMSVASGGVKGLWLFGWKANLLKIKMDLFEKRHGGDVSSAKSVLLKRNVTSNKDIVLEFCPEHLSASRCGKVWLFSGGYASPCPFEDPWVRGAYFLEMKPISNAHGCIPILGAPWHTLKVTVISSPAKRIRLLGTGVLHLTKICCWNLEGEADLLSAAYLWRTG